MEAGKIRDGVKISCIKKVHSTPGSYFTPTILRLRIQVEFFWSAEAGDEHDTQSEHEQFFFPFFLFVIHSGIEGENRLKMSLGDHPKLHTGSVIDLNREWGRASSEHPPIGYQDKLETPGLIHEQNLSFIISYESLGSFMIFFLHVLSFVISRQGIDILQSFTQILGVENS